MPGDFLEADLPVFFAGNEFGQAVTWQNRIGVVDLMAILDKPDALQFENLRSTDRVIRFAGLNNGEPMREGDTVIAENAVFRVSDVQAVDDGSTYLAQLAWHSAL